MAKSIKVTMDNPKKIINRIINDKVRLFASDTWAKYFKKYTPMESGTLGSTYITEPGKVTYTSDYAHYQWEGKLYVDPITHKGAFYDPNYGFWSRPGVTKIPSNKSLVYSKDKNPGATSHWEVPAQENYKSQVAQEIEDYIKRM